MSEEAISPAPRLLLVEDDSDSRIVFARWLRAGGYDVEEAMSLEQAMERLSSRGPDAVCLDLGLPDAHGIDALDALRKRDPSVPIIVLTAETEVDIVVTAMQKGAFGYLAKPVPRERLLEAAKRAALRGRMERVFLDRDATDGMRGSNRLIGPSCAMSELRLRIRRVAVSDVAVLVQGESGVGKELVARAVHEESARKDGPFVALNCAAIPESLQESELFGHEKGSFTGAVGQKRGYFELAAGGTLFLDEVAELAPSLQAKLLRVVQEKSFRRVGGTTDVASDFRIVAASHRKLWDEVAADRFRSDLYYRIAVFELQVPPLRGRREDVLFLCRLFIADRFPDGHVALSPEAEQLLVSYPWPGNVRELKNALHHALVLRSSDTLTAADFPERVREYRPNMPEPPSGARNVGDCVPPVAAARNVGDCVPPVAAARNVGDGVPPVAAAPSDDRTTPVSGFAFPQRPVGPLPAAAAGAVPPSRGPDLSDGRLDALERRAIERMISSVNGSITEAARRLGISRATLYRRLKQYGPS